MRRLVLDLEWRTTAFTLLMLPLLIALGFWQLQRAQEKQALSAAFEAQQAREPVALSRLLAQQRSELLHREVILKGHFLPEARIFLDNRVQGGRFGYEVLDVLRLESPARPRLVLVNRGWVAADAARRSQPEVPVLQGEQELRGRVYFSPGKPYLLGEQALDTDCRSYFRRSSWTSWPRCLSGAWGCRCCRSRCV